MTVRRFGPGPVFGPPKVLFPLTTDLYGGPGDNYTPWDITRDGQRFIMARRVRKQAEDAPLVVVDNWFEELRQKTKRR